MRAKVVGGEVSFEVRGTGEPAMLLLHAFPLDRRMWNEAADFLATRHRVITMDLRGFGESPLGATEASIETFADDAAAVLAAAGVDRAIVCGLSMGGYAALALARKHPGLLQGLVLADTRAGADSSDGRRARDEAIAFVEARGVEAYVERSLPKLLSPGAAAAVRDRVRALGRQSPAAIVAGLKALRDRPDRTAELAAIGCPTLCLCGAKDEITPPAEAKAMAEKIPDARIVEIPDAGHLANLENPGAFHAALREFVAAMA